MRGYRFPSTETEHQTVISRFGGADFRSHPTKVSLTRSPDLQNLVCDRNDFLVKRTGWQVQQRYDAPVYGIFSAPDGAGAFIHTGADLYFRAENGQQTVLCPRHERRVLAGVYHERRALSARRGAFSRSPPRRGRRMGGCPRAEHRLCADDHRFRPSRGRRRESRGGQSADRKAHQYLCRRRKKHRISSGCARA